jgi:hypothetical protein
MHIKLLIIYDFTTLIHEIEGVFVPYMFNTGTFSPNDRQIRLFIEELKKQPLEIHIPAALYDDLLNKAEEIADEDDGELGKEN